MRSFFRDHWKAIVVILLLVVLATFTVTPGAAPIAPSLAERLRAHASALAAAYARADGAAYVTAALRAQGYRVRHPAGAAPGELDASIANVAPGARAARVFVIGAREDAGAAAAVLELARLLRHMRPDPGTELRFVFLPGAPAPDAIDGADAANPCAGSFVAFAGTLAAARQVLQALSAFQSTSGRPARGLAAPAYAQGLTLSRQAAHGASAYPAMMVTGTAFGRTPYLNTADGSADSAGADAPPDDPRDYAGIAHAVSGLAHTIEALAGGRQG